MPDDADLRPYRNGEPDLGGSSPHLADYWQVITRRLWLVLLIFGVTTASAIWAVSRQRTFYQAHLSLHVTDPLQRTRSLTPGARISGMDIFVDPIQSEIEVLRSSPIALQVVRELGLRLRPTAEDLVRSQILREIEIGEDGQNGSYELVYDEDGQTARLRGPSGETLGSAPVGDVLDEGALRFVPQPPPTEQRVYSVTVVPAENVVGEVRGSISASPRENTNIIDVTFTSPDPVLASKILNEAGEALRAYGSRKVSIAASQNVRFIEEQRLVIHMQQVTSQVDSPPVPAVTDSSVLAVHTDGVVLVLRSGETEQRAAERAVDQLPRLDVRVFGAVLNEVSTATTEESYYLQYYYSYEPDERAGLSSKLRERISKARFW